MNSPLPNTQPAMSVSMALRVIEYESKKIHEFSDTVLGHSLENIRHFVVLML